MKLESEVRKKRSVVLHIEKKAKNQLWEGKRSQKGQRKEKKSENPVCGQVKKNKKGEMLQKMGDT